MPSNCRSLTSAVWIFTFSVRRATSRSSVAASGASSRSSLARALAGTGGGRGPGRGPGRSPSGCRAGRRRSARRRTSPAGTEVGILLQQRIDRRVGDGEPAGASLGGDQALAHGLVERDALEEQVERRRRLAAGLALRSRRGRAPCASSISERWISLPSTRATTGSWVAGTLAPRGAPPAPWPRTARGRTIAATATRANERRLC